MRWRNQVNARSSHCSRVDQPFASVGVTDQVRRLARLSPHLDDLGRLVGNTNSPGCAHATGHPPMPAWEPPFQGRVRIYARLLPGTRLRAPRPNPVARQFPGA